MIAIDGSKLSANASQESTRGYEQIVAELLERAEQTDEQEDQLYGDHLGDELPQELTTREGRKKMLADAKRKLIERRAGEQRPIPKGKTARLKARHSSTREAVDRLPFRRRRALRALIRPRTAQANPPPPPSTDQPSDRLLSAMNTGDDLGKTNQIIYPPQPRSRCLRDFPNLCVHKPRAPMMPPTGQSRRGDSQK
jgi:hypothetical protein